MLLIEADGVPQYFCKYTKRQLQRLKKDIVFLLFLMSWDYFEDKTVLLIHFEWYEVVSEEYALGLGSRSKIIFLSFGGCFYYMSSGDDFFLRVILQTSL